MIRAATRADVAAVTALETALFGADAWSADTVAAELCGARRRALVAGDGGAPAGYAVTALAGGTADLTRVAVAPAHRRTGLASRMLATLAALAVRDGADRMLLEVAAANHGALRLYRSAGFTEVARRVRYYRDGSDALVLRRTLRAVPEGTR